MTIDRIFRVRARRLNLRQQPGTEAKVLVTLDEGQALARLDGVDRGGWWYVFADTPGEGIFLGHVWSQYLAPAFGGGEAQAPRLPEPAAVMHPDEADRPADGEDTGSPARDAVGAAGGILDAGAPGAGEPAPAPAWPDGWNPSVPAGRRHVSENQGQRAGNGSIDRVILHITGIRDFDAIVRRFTERSGAASAHYLVMPDGLVHQFVPENLRAFHSGINRTVRALYARQDGSWRQYKRYFSWHRGYPADAVFLDAANAVVAPSRRASEAVLVMPGHRGEWPDYAYFDRRWGRMAAPVGFTAPGHDPNNNSVGIEIFSVGARSPVADQYSPEMYSALASLVADICRRRGLPLTRDAVCGHEDVNPVERWGWDPNQGFDWERLFELARGAGLPGA